MRKKNAAGEIEQARSVAPATVCAATGPKTLHQHSRMNDLAVAIVAMSMIAAMAILPMPAATLIPVFFPAFFPGAAMTLPVTRNIFAVVPLVLHEEDPLAAGVVLAAMPVPMLDVARRHPQIDRRPAHRHPLDCDRLGIDDLRLRIVADVHPPIETGLADADGNSHVGSKGRCGKAGSQRGCDHEASHVECPFIDFDI